jgi:hypothetical protein
MRSVLNVSKYVLSYGNEDVIYTNHDGYVKAFFNMEDLYYFKGNYSYRKNSFTSFCKISRNDVRRLIDGRICKKDVLEKYVLNNNLEMF